MSTPMDQPERRELVCPECFGDGADKYGKCCPACGGLGMVYEEFPAAVVVPSPHREDMEALAATLSDALDYYGAQDEARRRRTMSETLKPCPFCGCEAGTATHQGVHAGYCTSCSVVTATYPTEAEAIVAWNRRAPSPHGKDVESITADAVSGQQENMMAAIIQPHGQEHAGMTQEMRAAVGSEWAPNQCTGTGSVEPGGYGVIADNAPPEAKVGIKVFVSPRCSICGALEGRGRSCPECETFRRGLEEDDENGPYRGSGGAPEDVEALMKRWYTWLSTNRYRQPAVQTLLDEVVPLLRSRPVEPEPVGWRWRSWDDSEPGWQYHEKSGRPNLIGRYELQALYASPVAPREPEK